MPQRIRKNSSLIFSSQRAKKKFEFDSQLIHRVVDGWFLETGRGRNCCIVWEEFVTLAPFWSEWTSKWRRVFRGVRLRPWWRACMAWLNWMNVLWSAVSAASLLSRFTKVWIYLGLAICSKRVRFDCWLCWLELARVFGWKNSSFTKQEGNSLGGLRHPSNWRHSAHYLIN